VRQRKRQCKTHELWVYGVGLLLLEAEQYRSVVWVERSAALPPVTIAA